MWKTVVGLILTGLLIFVSCNNDDDNLSKDEQNDLDDLAIVEFLKAHYFTENGKVKAFDDEDEEDDNETPLYDLAIQDPMGYWYAHAPGAPTTGETINSPITDSILIQLETNYFYASYQSDTATFKPLYNYATESTINGTGQPKWDPGFYYTDLTEYVEAGNDNYKEEYFVWEGFIEGLKHFPKTGRLANALPSVDFQGVIIIPSRLAFGRDYQLSGFARDACMIVNFELYDIVNRPDDGDDHEDFDFY